MDTQEEFPVQRCTELCSWSSSLYTTRIVLVGRRFVLLTTTLAGTPVYMQRVTEDEAYNYYYRNTSIVDLRKRFDAIVNRHLRAFERSIK